VRTSYGQKGDTSDDTHGEGRSVAVWVDCEVARLGVSVLWSIVCHCDYCELCRQLHVMGGTMTGSLIGTIGLGSAIKCGDGPPTA